MLGGCVKVAVPSSPSSSQTRAPHPGTIPGTILGALEKYLSGLHLHLAINIDPVALSWDGEGLCIRFLRLL